jgi:colanic acid/amylovoran biosynthesis glycosyltransferase
MSKIAFIFSQFPAYDETFILREMNELDKAGLVFDIYSLKTPKDKIIHDEAKALASRTSYLPFFSWGLLGDDLYYLFRRPWRYMSIFFGVLLRNLPSPNFFFKTCALWYKAVGFARLAEKTGIMHVHGQWATFPATVALIISRLNNIPFSFTGHAHDIYLDTTMLGYKIKAAKFVATCTGDNKRHLIEVTRSQGHKVTGEKIVISYHGVDLERFKRVDELRVTSCELEKRKIKILSVGSLLECKGFEYLIEACKILKDEGVDFECTIAGGGKLEESLRLRVARCELKEKVKFTGFITQDQLIPLYKQTDVFVLAMVPEIHWGIPNVLLEAMACGKPVVCTMLPSIPELVKDGETGYIIPAKDPVAIALATKKLIQDEASRKRIGEAGRRAVEEKFDVVRNALKLKELFNS